MFNFGNYNPTSKDYTLSLQTSSFLEMGTISTSNMYPAQIISYQLSSTCTETKSITLYTFKAPILHIYHPCNNHS